MGQDSRFITLSEQVVQNVLDYLSTQPYRNVVNLINRIAQEVEAQQKAPAAQEERGEPKGQ